MIKSFSQISKHVRIMRATGFPSSGRIRFLTLVFPRVLLQVLVSTGAEEGFATVKKVVLPLHLSVRFHHYI